VRIGEEDDEDGGGGDYLYPPGCRLARNLVAGFELKKKRIRRRAARAEHATQRKLCVVDGCSVVSRGMIGRDDGSGMHESQLERTAGAPPPPLAASLSDSLAGWLDGDPLRRGEARRDSAAVNQSFVRSCLLVSLSHCAIERRSECDCMDV
jgi:hypothetical protein